MLSYDAAKTSSQYKLFDIFIIKSNISSRFVLVAIPVKLVAGMEEMAVVIVVVADVRSDDVANDAIDGMSVVFAKAVKSLVVAKFNLIEAISVDDKF